MADGKLKVILDTNVFIAGYWSTRSASARLVAACMEGRLQAVYSPEIRREVERMLKQIKVRAAYVQMVDRFWANAAEVSGIEVDVRVDDADDLKFLQAAAAAEADFLATNDDHLLRVGYIGRTEIITPGSLTRLLGF